MRSAAKALAFKGRPVSAPLAAVIGALVLLAAASGWRLLAGRSVTPSAPAHLSIVVLPFANLSGDPTQDYFADGITENLTTDLSRLSGSFVIARNTALQGQKRGCQGDRQGAWRSLGSVQRDQNQVRINAQLIDAESGGHLWAERFDKHLSNLFSMQDEIVASLASRLGAELITNEARRAERTPNPDSMDLYFQGMAWFNKGRNPADIARAHDFFEREPACQARRSRRSPSARQRSPRVHLPPDRRRRCSTVIDFLVLVILDLQRAFDLGDELIQRACFVRSRVG